MAGVSSSASFVLDRVEGLEVFLAARLEERDASFFLGAALSTSMASEALAAPSGTWGASLLPVSAMASSSSASESTTSASTRAASSRAAVAGEALRRPRASSSAPRTTEDPERRWVRREPGTPSSSDYKHKSVWTQRAVVQDTHRILRAKEVTRSRATIRLLEDAASVIHRRMDRGQSAKRHRRRVEDRCHLRQAVDSLTSDDRALRSSASASIVLTANEMDARNQGASDFKIAQAESLRIASEATTNQLAASKTKSETAVKDAASKLDAAVKQRH